MSKHVLFLALGLGTGAIYALLGVGLVLQYRSSGVVNFAQGAIATLVAYVFVELRATGELVLPWLGLPNRIALGHADMALLPSMAISLTYAAALGLLLYVLVFRPLRASPVLSKVVASIGLLLALQSLVVLQFGTTTKSTGAILPNEPIKLFDEVVPRDRLWLTAVAVIAAALLWALYRFTRFGLATRAAAENEKGATLLGYSSERIAAANWLLATLLAGVAGILIAPITTLAPAQYSLLVVPALCVALVGRFRSFGITALAGLALGMAQSEITKLQTDHTWFPQVGLKEGLPFLVILVAMALAGRSLPGRDALAEPRLPRSGRPTSPLRPALIATPVAVVALFALHGSLRGALIQSMVASLLCLSLVVLTGYIGQISLAQMSFAGVSGFALSKLSIDGGVPFPVSLLLAALVAVPVGLLVGLPALRVRGVQLAVITIAAAVAIDQFIFNNPDLTGGYAGSKVPPARLFGVDLDIRSARVSDYPRPVFGIFVLVVLALTAVAVTNLRRNATGRRMLAVRSNERAAAAAGIDARATKLLAFSLSAFIAGLAGGVIGYQRGQLSIDSFGVFVSLSLLAFAYLGGIARVSGAIVGGLFVATGGLLPVALDRWIDFGRYQLLVSGIALIGIAIAHPDGLATTLDRPLGALRRRVRRISDAPTTRIPSTAGVPKPSANGMTGAARTAPAPSVASEGRPGCVPSETLLSVQNLAVRFGGLRAVDDVSLAVPAGQLVGLIGPNGAGKTTFIDAVTGYLPQSQGTVRFMGERVDGLRPHQLARLGLTRTFQSVELFDDLSVYENLLVAGEPVRWWTSVADLVHHRRERTDRVTWALGAVGMDRVASAMPGELSHGQRKLVSVARSIASRPDLVLLDEPAAGLDSRESKELGRHLRTLIGEGIGVLLVDHDMTLVLDVCDEVWVLDFGRLVSHGNPAEIREDAAVISAYLGEPVPGDTPELIRAATVGRGTP